MWARVRERIARSNVMMRDEMSLSWLRGYGEQYLKSFPEYH